MNFSRHYQVNNTLCVFTTGGSSPSSSDDEIKEAFGSPSCRRNHSPPTHFAWAVHPSTATTPHFSPSSFSASFPTTSTATTFTSPPSSSSSSSPKQPVSAWNIEAARRPHRVVPPIGRHKHKFFAQMPSSFSDRPFLDFNKMQHSKRLVMVSSELNKQEHPPLYPVSACKGV